ncbi:MAG: hypothetical protein ACEY3E_07580 [Candidatus Tisiphia sp.]
MHLKIPTVTKQIITLCCQHLSIPLHATTVESLQIPIPQRHCERKRSNLGNNL